jgi:nucleotide-binding universal stress UspA family protein
MIKITEIDEQRETAPPPNVIHGLHLWNLREIVVPTDLGVERRNAVAYAMILARPCNAHLTLLHVYKEPYSLEYLRGPGVGQAREQHRQCAKNALELLGKQARKEYQNCSTEFREGAVCEEIANAAQDLQADLMVIASRANKWVRRCAYGSDADAIVRIAPCPVLIVH